MNRFCTKCGTELVDGACPKCSQVQLNRTTEKFKHFFMNPKEQFVCALGNGYIQNYLAGGFVGKGFAVVSDKRVYFNGKTYEVHNSRLKATSESRTVDLKDVTGTGVRAIKYPLLWIVAAAIGVMLLIAAILCYSIGETNNTEDVRMFGSFLFSNIFIFIPLCLFPAAAFYLPYYLTHKTGFLIVAVSFTVIGLVGVSLINITVPNEDVEAIPVHIINMLIWAIAVLLFIYFKTRITLLTISYAGGCIAFDINWYSKEESDGFQKMLRIAKDKAVEEAENATANAMREVMSNVVGTPVQPVQSVQPQTPIISADELMKYAQLYKDGLLSEEEFAAIKAKML